MMNRLLVCVVLSAICFESFSGASPCRHGEICVDRLRCKEPGSTPLRRCGQTKYCCSKSSVKPYETGTGLNQPSKLGYAGASTVFPNLSQEARQFLGTYNYNGECGVRKTRSNRQSTSHSLESGQANYGEFPWQAAIFLRVSRKTKRSGAINIYKYHCGGAIVNERIVVTAAHCVYGVKKENLKVKLGEYNLLGVRGELFPPVVRHLTRVVVHDKYNPKKFVHDVAALILDKPVPFARTPHVSPVCLPPLGYKFDQHHRCFITGFGEDSYQPNYGSNVLKVTSVDLHSEDKCKDLLSISIPWLRRGFYHDSHRCFTGAHGKNACIGDGGGAVVCEVPNEKVSVCGNGYGCQREHYFLAGIISWGSENCEQENSVTVMSDMVHDRDWLLSVMRHGDRGNQRLPFY